MKEAMAATSTPRDDHTLTRAAGCRVAWAGRGDPNGPPVLLLHRNPGSRLFDPDPTSSSDVRLSPSIVPVTAGLTDRGPDSAAVASDVVAGHPSAPTGPAAAGGPDQAGDPRGSRQRTAPDIEPFEFGRLPGDGDEDVITGGALTGQRGFFTRDSSGAVIVDLAGRRFTRVPTASP